MATKTQLSAKEEAEKNQMEEDARSAATEAALAVQAAERANAKFEVSAPTPPAVPQNEVQRQAKARTVGDIPVTCLQTEPFCSLGGRKYVLKKGTEIMMDPSHAEELAQGGWVAPIRVIVSQSRNA